MPEPGRIVGAQDFLQQTLQRGLPFAIVTGSEASGKSLLIRRFLQTSEVSHPGHLAGATGDLASVSDYMIAATEAQLATEVTVAVRNRAIESFNEIMRMQV